MEKTPSPLPYVTLSGSDLLPPGNQSRVTPLDEWDEIHSLFPEKGRATGGDSEGGGYSAYEWRAEVLNEVEAVRGHWRQSTSSAVLRMRVSAAWPGSLRESLTTDWAPRWAVVMEGFREAPCRKRLALSRPRLWFSLHSSGVIVRGRENIT